MVTTNYQTYGTKGFQLRFRMYQSGEVRYIAVNNLLQGNLLAKHWNQKKQMFIPSAPFSEENNAALVAFKSKYDAALMNWEGSLFNFNLTVKRDGIDSVKDDGKKLFEVLEWVVENAKKSKHSDGTICGTYESYMKVIRRIREYCAAHHLAYEKIKMDDVTVVFVNDLLEWVCDSKKGKAQYFSCMFRAAMNKAVKQGWADETVVKKCRWIPRVRNSQRKYETLTAEQCSRFVSMPASDLPPGPKSELYRDFCVFILYTCQSACDAIALKYADIKKIDGVDHFVFKRRKIDKKQSIECTVPINDVMRGIMDKWRPLAQDGYIFPIRNKRKLAENMLTNADIKMFIKKCNVWLKKLGEILGCDFPLHTYVFRHTAITHYISKGIPVVYVANLAGTSVENCEGIYYNNKGDVVSRDKVLAAVKF